MNWYYLEDGQQKGPVSQEEFVGLVKKGVIRAETLLWSEGLADWRSYGDLLSRAAPATRQTADLSVPATEEPAPAAAGSGLRVQIDAAPPVVQPTSVCSQCGATGPLQRMVRIGARLVCPACREQLARGVAAGEAGAGTLRPAGFWIRVAAKLLDGLALFVIIGALAVVFGLMSQFQHGGARGKQQDDEIIAFVVIFFVPMAYSTLLVGIWGITLGKLACGLKVVSLDGRSLSLPRSWWRFLSEILSLMACLVLFALFLERLVRSNPLLALILSFFGLAFSCAGYLPVAFTKNKRGLHDMLAGTRVIKTR